jgi:O-antigen/teichoic acid export membrane protein
MLDNLLKRLPVSKRFSTDVLWNIASFLVLGVCGILLNILISKYYGSSVLGVFNQAIALYAMVAQFSVLGVHLSVLRHIAEFADDEQKSKEIFSAALWLTVLIAAAATTFFFLMRGAFGALLNSPDVAEAITFTIPGLFLFSLNKVILNYLNGKRQMKAYAVFQTLRYLLLVGFLITLIALSAPGNLLTIIFTCAEAILFAILLAFNFRSIIFRYSAVTKEWVKKHFRFGLAALGGNIFSEFNPRVDVIILGIFASDSIVGIYSFAAMLVEGFNQLPAVIRANVNPILTQTYFRQGTPALQKLTTKGKRLAYLFLAPISLVVIGCFPIFYLINPSPDIQESWGIFAIMMLGNTVSIGYQPFLTMLNQTGFPAMQTALFACIFTTTVALTFLLAAAFSNLGTAIATAISMAMQAVFLMLLVRKALKIKI